MEVALFRVSPGGRKRASICTRRQTTSTRRITMEVDCRHDLDEGGESALDGSTCSTARSQLQSRKGRGIYFVSGVWGRQRPCNPLEDPEVSKTSSDDISLISSILAEVQGRQNH
ncbi:hypothetical protein C4D60_Mb03t11330 [Musa balbisiana]|uniref:Uncharacterized protein n=1 Tax=Musa balbisiana TaxID=52838 RepID=A0A4S8JA90_MUSBA|nr:hypothetical protein C4D60_Mb03t11330 [Musa balbisiana]